MKYLLYNPLSQNGSCESKIKPFLENNEYCVVNVLEKEEYEKVFNIVTSDDEIYLYGGDGTLNFFVNSVNNKELPCKVYFNTSGTGNDFYRDVAKDGDGELIEINKYITNLPKVIINGEERLFINGVGFGIDGYCCEVGDELQKKSTKPVNYGAIAVKGLLFDYKACGGTVTVDGVSKRYKRIWICPTMKGCFYGGGINVTPNQNRLDPSGVVSTAVFHSSGRIKTLLIFPKLFKGAHLGHTDVFDIFTGKHVIVEFDKPQALQIDGETVRNVTKYEVIV